MQDLFDCPSETYELPFTKTVPTLQEIQEAWAKHRAEAALRDELQRLAEEGWDVEPLPW